MKGIPELLTRDRDKRSLLSKICSALAVVIIILVLGGVMFRSRYTAYEIDGPSMQNTLFTGDWVYAEKRTAAERGDVVIVDVSDRKVFSCEVIIKRLIAVEGDSILCREGVVYRRIGEGDYEPLDEPYATGITQDFAEVTLKAGEIFVMGDNRPESFDCRSPAVGPLTMKSVIGVVPNWSLEQKAAVAKWEKFRGSVRDFFVDLFD